MRIVLFARTLAAVRRATLACSCSKRTSISITRTFIVHTSISKRLRNSCSRSRSLDRRSVVTCIMNPISASPGAAGSHDDVRACAGGALSANARALGARMCPGPGCLPRCGVASLSSADARIRDLS